MLKHLTCIFHFCLESQGFGAITEYPSTIVFLKRHPLKNEAYISTWKLADGYWFSFFVYVANRSFVVSVSTIWNIKQTINQVNRRITRDGVIQRKRLHWNSAERNINMISMQSQANATNRFQSNRTEVKCFNRTISSILILWRAENI